MRAVEICASHIGHRRRVSATSCSFPPGSPAARSCPELPSLQGWLEAMTSLGRLIFFDQPGTGASDPLPRMRCPPWNIGPTASPRSSTISAVTEAILFAVDGAFVGCGAVRGDASVAHVRTRRAGGLRGYEDHRGRASTQYADGVSPPSGAPARMQHVLNPDMPWNEEIRAAWARMERLAASPSTVSLMLAARPGARCRAVLPTVRVPTLVLHHADDAILVPANGQYVADHIPGAKYVELPGRNMYHFVEPGGVRRSRRSPSSSPAIRPTSPTIAFLPPCCSPTSSTRHADAAEIGDSDWRALLDAHDAVVRSQLARFRGREVNTSGDGFLATFDGPQRAIRCAMAIRDAVQAARHRSTRGPAHR